MSLASGAASLFSSAEATSFTGLPTPQQQQGRHTLTHPSYPTDGPNSWTPSNFPPELQVMRPNPRNLWFSPASLSQGSPQPRLMTCKERWAPSKMPSVPSQGTLGPRAGVQGMAHLVGPLAPAVSLRIPSLPQNSRRATSCLPGSHSLLHLPPRSSTPSEGRPPPSSRPPAPV